MSRLSRLWSFWRSQRRGQIRDGGYALRFWRLLRSATREEWTAGLWIGVAPAFFHWYAFAAAPLVLGLIWRGSERRLRREDAQSGRGADSYRPHRAVNLLPAEYRDTGTLSASGSWVLSASTGTKEHGTRTPATATTVAFSSSPLLGDPLVVNLARISHHPVSSCTARFWYGDGTEDPGASGAPRGLAT